MSRNSDPLRKIETKTPDGASLSRRIEYAGPEKLKAPDQRQLTGASLGVLAESCLNALSECTKS
jgi:hypothetical protein